MQNVNDLHEEHRARPNSGPHAERHKHKENLSRPSAGARLRPGKDDGTTRRPETYTNGGGEIRKDAKTGGNDCNDPKNVASREAKYSDSVG